MVVIVEPFQYSTLSSQIYKTFFWGLIVFCQLNSNESSVLMAQIEAIFDALVPFQPTWGIILPSPVVTELVIWMGFG